MDIKEKSVIETTINITASRTHGTKRVKFLNKKGTFQWHRQCDTCQHSGLVQAGLGSYVEQTCDRDGETWRKLRGNTKKPCSFHLEKEAGAADGLQTAGNSK